jgi:hypothetical protein
MTNRSPIRTWCRKTPQPAKLRLITADDEVTDVRLTADARNRWKTAEETILNTPGVVSVQAIDADGNILRTLPLAELVEDEDGAVGGVALADPDERDENRFAKQRTKDAAAMALMLDRYGHRLNEAFERGADAAAVSQENLVRLVETLSVHLSNAITNLHKVAVMYANQVQGDEPEDKNGALVAQVVGAAAAQMMTGASNGKK